MTISCGFHVFVSYCTTVVGKWFASQCTFGFKEIIRAIKLDRMNQTTSQKFNEMASNDIVQLRIRTAKLTNTNERKIVT